MGPLPGVQTVSKHKDKVRMLVLETDETHPDTQKEVGGFGEVFNNLFTKAGDDHDPQLGIETMMQYIVEPDGGEVPGPNDIPEDLHAILITGSEWDAHGDDEWIHKLMDFIKYIWTHRPDIKFTGICFGHQILCRALGSTVEPEANGEWELSHTELELSEVGRKLFRTQNAKIRLHQMHLDHVVNAPSPETTDLLEKGTKVHVWGGSDHTQVQGVYIQKRLFTSQGHMEFNERYVKRQLEMRVDAGSVEKNDADEAAERADWMHDGLVMAKAVLRFFHGDDDKSEFK
ncbi:class I glutamine amidotransferase-like protein [Didymella exigua CBS 183.55]|uniref:Class I glutamine amidotransferase-like protein n=1 Tax=Didymella exigua CBS 183.55 TaxID=1150837 RepID=A0A6A5RAV9_9PLEO|nr:class I glutamine amidotransferase-like protein [Didymella exigua CBS 183.55]KAF1925371.1 class I glutamine amidotransferase-like protein [Didymella exigua CBS 183.55]